MREGRAGEKAPHTPWGPRPPLLAPPPPPPPPPPHSHTPSPPRRFEDGTFDDEMVWAGHDKRVQGKRIKVLRDKIESDPLQSQSEEWQTTLRVEHLIAQLEAPLPPSAEAPSPLPHGKAGSLSLV